MSSTPVGSHPDPEHLAEIEAEDSPREPAVAEDRPIVAAAEPTPIEAQPGGAADPLAEVALAAAPAAAPEEEAPSRAGDGDPAAVQAEPGEPPGAAMASADEPDAAMASAPAEPPESVGAPGSPDGLEPGVAAASEASAAPGLATAAEVAGQAAASEAGEPAALPEGEHVVYPVREERKRALLLALLERGLLGKTIVFTRTKHRANRLTEWLAKRGMTVDRVHTQRSHRQRRDAMTGLCEGGVRVLVVAGRASRLLEMTVPCAIVHLDVPESLGDYRERLAAARWQDAGGGSFLLAAETDASFLKEIEAGLSVELPRRTLEDFDYEGPAPMPEAEPAEPVAHIGDRRPRARSRGARRRRRGEAPAEGPAGGEPRLPSAEAGANGGEDQEEARIRAIAEAQQAAAVAARLNPSRMGIMEWRDGRQAGGGRSSRRQAHRGH
jgi:hypothetical protein